MRVGIIAGGFKPFTTGHFSKVKLSLQRDDQTILIYSATGRGEGPGSLTAEQISDMWEILTPYLALLGVKAVRARTTPFKEVYAVIGAIRCILGPSCTADEKNTIDYFGLQPASSGAVLYGSNKDIYNNFSRFVGTPGTLATSSLRVS